ncbi:hypothetical protein G6F51_012093 [Rhizopus arrhizus]|uniref:Reverse transcriptase domain-containing protein n=2 Tax=Rhizopus oryzae TaxID=64495 RepID=A0A9P6XXC9_RHIOR|nr:hypothetical protein G6F51_012093 [Rhizopus arrhizus]
MTLLSKKDDLTSLKNWRPISLINTDAKVFTRLLNARLMPHLNRLISLQQLGFMPGRFIGENGKLLNVVMSVAEKTSSQAIGLLLDQEKAYDRIHPEYLRQSMSVLGIPSAVIDSLCTLFFSTSIRININGHLSDSFIQQRGLRQGDPISPLLFNIAFDPFIRSMNTSPDIAGFKFPPLAQETNSSVPTIKIMAYADDTLVLLDDPAEMPALQNIISMYSNASNALLNFGKTEAFSLSGSTLPLWRTYLQQLSPPITSWHDKSALSPLIYLGYPVYSSVTQRNQFVDQLLTKVKLSCQIHSQRSLSIRGRMTVLNTLIYSKLWHVLGVVPLTTTQLASFRSLGSAFLNNYRFPRIAYTALVPSRKVGGLGTLDPCIQQLTLQWRWVLPLLSGSSPTSVTAPFSVQYIRAALSFFTQGDYLRPLLFSQCRSGFSSLLNNPYKILFQAVDHLPKTFLQSRLNASTCVDLPLESALISPDNLSLSPPSPSLLDSLFPNFPGIRKLVVGDIVVYDTLLRSLRLRFRSEYRRLPTLTHKVVRAIQERQLRMSPFLLRLCLPGLVPPETVEGPTNYVPLCTHSLQIVASFGTHFRPVAYRDYLLSKLFPPKAFHPPIPQPKWLKFWKLPLPLPARTTWFRLLHKAIPCKQLLHSRIPTVHSSAACIFCNFEDDITHFFFECTFKSSLWSAALHRYFPSLQLSTDQTQTSVLTLSLGMADFETSPVIPNVSVLSLLGCILHTLWSAHWNHVFNNTRLTPTTLNQQLDRMVLRLNSELSPPPPRPTLHRLDSTS